LRCGSITDARFADVFTLICVRSICAAAASANWRERGKSPVSSSPADMLTRIRNANVVYHESVDVPHSNVKFNIAKILKEEGYIRNYKVINDPKKPYAVVRVFLNYGPNRERVIQGLRRISKPGRRIYVGKDNLPKVMGGLGIAIISTSQGLKTEAEASQLGLGGEVVCYVW